VSIFYLKTYFVVISSFGRMGNMDYERQTWFSDTEVSGHHNSDTESINRCINKMSINGRGNIKANPDIAVLNMGVTTEGTDLMSAQRENAVKTERVIEALKKAGIEDRDIETASYVIEPIYEYVEGKQIFKGYRVRNLLKVTVRDMGRTGQIIDTGVRNGTNIVRDVEFSVSNPSRYYDQALRLAIEDAVRKAEVAANTIGVSLNRVPKEIVEESFGVVLGVQSASMDVKAAVTPIRPGPIDVTANVKTTFCY
jgi:uncharacterized protein YggE